MEELELKIPKWIQIWKPRITEASMQRCLNFLKLGLMGYLTLNYVVLANIIRSQPVNTYQFWQNDPSYYDLIIVKYSGYFSFLTLILIIDLIFLTWSSVYHNPNHFLRKVYSFISKIVETEKE